MTLIEKYRRPGMSFLHALQTNGTLLNDGRGMPRMLDERP